MKKKWFQKGLCAGLAVFMALGLCACGNDSGSSGGRGGSGSGGRKGVSQDPALAKENVFSCQEFGDFPDMGDDFSVRTMTRKEDRIYLLAQVYHYDEYDNTQNDIRILSMDLEGSDIQTIQLQTGADNGGGDEAGDAAGGDGASEPAAGGAAGGIMPRMAVSSAAVDIAVPVDEEYVETNVYEYIGYNSFTFSKGDVLYGLKVHSLDDYRDQENPIYLNERFLCSWDMDGALLWEKDMAEIFSDDNYWTNSMAAMQDGSLVLLVEADGLKEIILDGEGNVTDEKELKDDKNVFENLSQVLWNEDGTAYVTYYDVNDDWNTCITTYDFKTGSLGEGQKLPDSLSWMGYNTIAAGVGTDLVFTNSYGVFTYNIGDADAVQIMDFVNSDLDTNSIFQISMIDDEHFVAFYYDRMDYLARGGYFTRVDPKDIPDKAVVLLAGNYLASDMKKRVIDFNKTNSEYRIVVKEYETYNTQSDYMAGYTQLNNDILAGNMPDILVCDVNMPIGNYISKGLIADAGRLLEEDEELSKAEYLENVFDAYKVDGTLYYVIPNFYVRCPIGKTSIVGDRESWTMKEFQELLATLPEGTQGFGEMSREQFVYTMMSYCGSDFVDVSTGKCDFNSQNFMSMLEYAKTLPEEIDYSQFGDDYWKNYESQYREDRTILLDCYINRMENINSQIKGYFGEEVSFIGFPTESGRGAMIGLGDYYVVSARSANQAGAWEFVRYYMTEDYQEGESSWRIPTNRNAFDKWLAKGMEKPYYLDENNEKVEYENTFYINGEEIPIPVMTQEEVDRIEAFIRSVDKPAYYNDNVENIIMEEAAAYFSGQKSVSDVAGIIQSRVQVYVNENM